jgi:hypothetical protein
LNRSFASKLSQLLDFDNASIADGELVRWDASAAKYKRASGLSLSDTGTLGLTALSFAQPPAVGTGRIFGTLAKLADGGQLTDFNWLSKITDIAGETVDNWVVGWGFNGNADFQPQVSGQHAILWRMEERFKQAGQWLTEVQLAYYNSSAVQKRLCAWYTNLGTDFTEWLNQCDSFELRVTSADFTSASAWFSATSTALTYAGTCNLTTIQFPSTVATKINLYSNTFGIGIASGELGMWVPNGSIFSVHAGGAIGGTTLLTVNSSGNGSVSGTWQATTITGSTAVNGGTMSGTTVSASTAFRAAVGGVSTPGLSFTGNTNYGFYLISSGISTTINGTRVMFIDASGLGLNKIRRMSASVVSEWAVDEGTNAAGLAFYYTGNKANSSGTYALLDVGAGAAGQFGPTVWTGTGGTFRCLAITPSYNQASGNASNTDLYINRTQTAVGSGAQWLAWMGVSTTFKFGVDNVGLPNFSQNTTGAGTPQLGTNSPAVTNTAPYTWITAKSSDGSTVYIPAWK